MAQRDSSPRRRHILASINREVPEPPRHRESASPSAAGRREREAKTRVDETESRGDESEAKAQGDAEDRSRPHRHRRRLRLKDPKRKSRRRRSRDRSKEDRSREDRSRADRSRADRSRADRSRDDPERRRRRRRRTRSPTPPDPYEEPPLDPEAAFRESLFDAMADDEGAAYWEGVYGQPVHVYANEREGPQGELERMTDEEYAAHVRQRMWEKTHEGLIEERRKREERARERERAEKERRRVEREVQRSLLVGEERRKRRVLRDRWGEYVKRWEGWDGAVEGIPWPVESGVRGDVSEDAVKTFVLGGLRRDGVGEDEFVKALRDERVRWHPDKIQQRLGGEVDAGVMRDVTVIFQTVDGLYNDTRRRSD